MKRQASRLLDWVLMLSLTASLPGCATGGSAQLAAHGPVVGQPLPDLALRDVASGQSLSLKSLAGQVVLLDIWASWCGPCKEELPLLDEMAGRLAGTGVAIVAVSIDEDPAAMSDFLRLKKTWQLRVAHDPLRRVPSELQPAKMPTSYLVDRQGVLQKIYGGFTRADVGRIEEELKGLSRP